MEHKREIPPKRANRKLVLQAKSKKARKELRAQIPEKKIWCVK